MHLAIGATHTLLQRILGVDTIVTELGGILVRKCGLRAQQLRGIQQMHLVLQSTRESFFINNTKIYFCLYYDYFYLLQDSHVIDLKIICTEKKMKVLYFFLYIFIYIFFWLASSSVQLAPQDAIESSPCRASHFYRSPNEATDFIIKSYAIYILYIIIHMCFPICYMIYSIFVVFQNNETFTHTTERERKRAPSSRYTCRPCRAAPNQLSM